MRNDFNEEVSAEAIAAFTKQVMGLPSRCLDEFALKCGWVEEDTKGNNALSQERITSLKSDYRAAYRFMSTLLQETPITVAMEALTAASLNASATNSKHQNRPD